MANELMDALTELADRFVRLAAEDDQLRAPLRRLAEAILRETWEPPAGSQPAPPQPSEPEASSEEPPPPAEPASPAATPPPPAAEPQPLPELTLGKSPPPEEPAEAAFPSRWRAVTGDEDLPLIRERCRLKAAGARWAATRRRRLAAGADFAAEIAPTDRDIIAQAKTLPDCFLWMCHPDGPAPEDLGLYEHVAGCFDAVAAVLDVLRQIQEDPETLAAEFGRALDLLAESQSALRMAIAALDGPTDSDQVQVFNWLKATAAERQIYIPRYMRADDPADPTAWKELAARVTELDAQLQENQRRNKHRRKLLGKVRHRASLIAENPEGARDQWEILAAVVEELVSEDSLPPSNRELRELLVPVIDNLPDLPELPPGFQLVLREIDRYLANCPEPELPPVVQPSPQVRDVQNLVAGRSLVLIGGDRRPASHQAIKDAFCLQDLIWIETREHESISGFEPYIARPEVAAVLLAIRWSSHSFADVKEFCDRHGKPLVRLPAGYNPNQVAAQIMAQCSERLRANGSPAE